jgi:hypothetical protein
MFESRRACFQHKCLRGQEREISEAKSKLAYRRFEDKAGCWSSEELVRRPVESRGQHKERGLRSRTAHFKRPGETVGTCDRGQLSSWTVRPKEA